MRSFSWFGHQNASHDTLVAALLRLMCRGAGAGPGWAPRYKSMGMFCTHGLKGNDGDCGCENTFRKNGTMYMMESVVTHPCEKLFPIACATHSPARTSVSATWPAGVSSRT